MPLFFGHFAQVGLWAEFLVWLGALQTYDDAFYISFVTFATLGYCDIVLAPGYRIFGALAATCGTPQAVLADTKWRARRQQREA